MTYIIFAYRFKSASFKQPAQCWIDLVKLMMLYAMTGFDGFSFKSIASLTYRSCKYDCAINTEQY